MKDRIVVAHYSPIPAALLSLFMVGIIGWFYVDTLCRPSGQIFSSILSNGQIWLPKVIACWVGGPLVVAVFGLVLVRVLFDGRRAVWVKDRKLIYLHRMFVCVDCSKIEEISQGTAWNGNGRPAIILKIRNGKSSTIPTALFSESRDELIDRLKTIVFYQFRSNPQEFGDSILKDSTNSS